MCPITAQIPDATELALNPVKTDLARSISQQVENQFMPLEKAFRVGRRVHWVKEVDSTNRLAMDAGGDGDVYIAESQTAGRGRQGRFWSSAHGLGLWMSIVFEQETRVELLTATAALAIKESLAPHLALAIKWPNDLLYAGKKVCGILTECRNARAVVGIGLNVHHRLEDFPPDLHETAASLAMATGRLWDRVELFTAILRNMDLLLERVNAQGEHLLRRQWADAVLAQGAHDWK